MFSEEIEVNDEESVAPSCILGNGASVSRRSVIIGGVATVVLMGIPTVADASEGRMSNSTLKPEGPTSLNPVGTMTAKDGTQIYFKDWGSGEPIVFSHGWPLNADAWDSQMLFLARHGYRVIAHDRRGHGRSGQSRNGNELDTYADDLAQLLDALNLTNVMLVGHSTGGGEVVRYIGRHGTRRLSKLVLIGSITPTLLRTDSNPMGIPIAAFNDVRNAVSTDRSQFLKDLSLPFFGYNKPGAKISEGVRDEFWRQGMQAAMLGTYDCIKAQSETDMTEDLKRIDVPTLILHGEHDQLVPIADTAMLTAKIIKEATLRVYPGAPHGMTIIFADQVNHDLLTFRRAYAAEAVSASLPL